LVKILARAAVLRVKLRYLDEWSEGRQRNAERYRAELGKTAIPVRPAMPASYQTRHIYNQFTIRCAERDRLQGYLKEQGIGSEIYYPLPLHLQPCYADLGHNKGDFPVSERLAAESLSLPVQGELGYADIDYVCDTIRSFYDPTCKSAQS
jgi:dTDP-4-amino-4,6-dideoxygalactose transaminase